MKEKIGLMLAVLAVFILSFSTVQAADPAKKVIIGISKIVSHPALDAVEKGIQDELAKSRLNVEYDLQNANGDIGTSASIANKFQSEKVTLAVGIATPTAQSLVNTLKSTPIVFAAVTDPVKAGLVKSLKGGDKWVTGVSDMTPVKQQIELLLRIKKIKRLGHIYTSSEENAVVLAGIVKQACRELGIEYRGNHGFQVFGGKAGGPGHYSQGGCAVCQHRQHGCFRHERSGGRSHEEQDSDNVG